jgi:poly(3-hydroxybutyrate) depolymerase
MRFIIGGLAASAVSVAVLAASPAAADVVQKTARVGGTTLAYQVYTPPGYDPAKAYPAVLVFTGGGQSIEAAKGTILADWAPEAAKRGYIVISPAAPNGDLFFEKGDRVFPGFLDQIRRDYKIAGKLHLAGHSNGGLSAFHVAARWPAYFSTVTGYPGLFDEPDLPRMTALKPMCVSMHVGDGDPIWWAAMQDQYEQMQKRGFRIKLSVEKGQGHRLKASELDLPKRLFDEIEACK